MLIGSISVVGGTSVYYFLPEGFLMENYTMLLNIFFMILSGLILGLTLLMNNFQGIFELVLTHLLFFWERKAMRILLRKNLTAHKARNKLTSLIYALTLGCIFVLIVAADF